MQAIILAGGMGTRLRPLTYTVPKPMLPVANRPALAHTIEALAKAGCHEVIITTNYLADEWSKGFMPCRCRFACAACAKSSLWGRRAASRTSLSSLTTNLSSFRATPWPTSITASLIEFHRAKNADVTIAVMRVQDTREFGVVAIDEECRITRFQEKPRPEEAFSDLANAGFYVVRKRVFDEVPAGEPYDFSRQLFPRLMAEDARFFAYDMQGYWVDIGRIQHYLEGNMHRIRDLAEVSPEAPASRKQNWCRRF